MEAANIVKPYICVILKTAPNLNQPEPEICTHQCRSDNREPAV